MPRPDTGKTPSYNKRSSNTYYHKMKDDPVFKEKARLRNEALKAKLKEKRRLIKEQKEKDAQSPKTPDTTHTNTISKPHHNHNTQSPQIVIFTV